MINRRQALQFLSLGVTGSLGCASGILSVGKSEERFDGPSKRTLRPNILFAIADDWSFPHAGILGDRVVKTPVFDRIAREGIVFTNAHCAAPSCTPSRGAILSGQAIHRLGEGANLHSTLSPDVPLYTDVLEANGYAVGTTGKGWGPGDFRAGERARNPAGNPFKDFDSFLDQKPSDQPFCFWFGSVNPHRPYEKASGLRSGMSPDEVEVPPFLPDTPEVRRDILDYYYEVQAFDAEVGRLLQTLEARGLSDNTLIVMTSDNGMPFPRAKTNLYGSGTHMPLAMRWSTGILTPGRVVDGLVSFTDFAPTFLELCGFGALPTATGQSLVDILDNQPRKTRDRIFVERERHTPCRENNGGYPSRAIRTQEFLLIRNFRPDRFPSGNVSDEFNAGDIDGSPTKDVILSAFTDPASVVGQDPRLPLLASRACARRPAIELYDLSKDPWELNNVASESAYTDVRDGLTRELEDWLIKTEDPRMLNDDDRWDEYPYYGRRRQILQ